MGHGEWSFCGDYCNDFTKNKDYDLRIMNHGALSRVQMDTGERGGAMDYHASDA